MKNINQTIASPIGRIFVYLSIFIGGSAVYELLLRLVNPSVWSNSSVLLTLTTLVTFVLIGAFFACEQHAMSRVTSAATLLVLAHVGLGIGRHAVPDTYLLVIALAVAVLGAQSVFHRRVTDIRKIVLYSFLTIFVAIALIISFNYMIAIVDTAAIQRQFGS